MKANSIEELFGTLQQSIVAEWRKHLKTSKYSKHMALDEFYKEMPEKVDKLIEDYMGHNKAKVEDYVNVLKAEDLDALGYLEALHDLCIESRDLLGGATELESDMDDILGLIDSVMYKVRELKEGIKSLTDFLKESLTNEEEWTTNIDEAAQLQCEIRFHEYDRGPGRDRKAKFKAIDLYDAVRTIADKCGLYLYVEEFDEPGELYYVDDNASKKERDEKAHAAIENVLSSNGDGCDFIYYFKAGREVLIDEGDPEEMW